MILLFIILANKFSLSLWSQCLGCIGCYVKFILDWQILSVNIA